MKRVCFIIKVTNNYGGAERRFARLINYISSDLVYRIKVILVGQEVNTNKFVIEYLKNKRITIIKTNNEFKLLSSLWSLNTDILHLVTINTSFIFVYSLLKLFRKKFEIILSLNSYDLCIGNYKSFLQKVSYHKLVKIVHKIDCLYPSYVENIKKISNEISSNKVKVFYPENSFTDLNKFQPSYNKKRIIVFASRLIDQKNPILAIQAINECKDDIRRNKYKVIFAGGGPLFSFIKGYIKDNNLDDIVEMTGNIDLSKMLPTSSIFLSIQDVENYPSQSLLEAIATGNYIIASDVGDTKRVVKKDFGKLTNLNKSEMVNAVLEAINLTCEEERMSIIVDAARDFANENFKIDKYSDHIKKVWIDC